MELDALQLFLETSQFLIVSAFYVLFTHLLVPTVSFTGVQPSYCLGEQLETLTGNPPGGIFAGPGVSGNTFSPSLAGESGVAGHKINYTFTDAHGCTNYSETFVNVTGPCGREFSSSDIDLCSYSTRGIKRNSYFLGMGNQIRRILF